MGIKDLDNIFWWAEPLNRVNTTAGEGLPSGRLLNRQSFRSLTCARASLLSQDCTQIGAVLR